MDDGHESEILERPETWPAESKPVIAVSECVTDQALEAVNRLRYEIDHDEFNYGSPYYDHDRRLVDDPFTPVSTTFAVSVDGVLVATMRHTSLDRIDIAPMRAPYGLDLIMREFEPDRINFVSGLAIARAYRRSLVLGRLLSVSYEHMIDNGAEISLCAALPSAVALYEKVSYRRYKSNIILDKYGYRIPMMSVTRDQRYLRQIRAIYHRTFRRLKATPANEDLFARLYPQYHAFYSNDFSTNLRNALALTNFGKQDSLVFAEIDKDDIEQFLSQMQILEVRQDDVVLIEGEVSSDAYFVLSGTLGVYSSSGNEDFPVAYIGEGDIVGELAFFADMPRSATIKCLTDAVLVIMSPMMFEKAAVALPEVTARVMFNIARRMVHRFVAPNIKEWNRAANAPAPKIRFTT